MKYIRTIYEGEHLAYGVKANDDCIEIKGMGPSGNQYYYTDEVSFCREKLLIAIPEEEIIKGLLRNHRVIVRLRTKEDL